MSDIYITGEAVVVPFVPNDLSIINQPDLFDGGFLRAVEPNYTEFLSPLALRRMSRMLKNGLTCALMCLKNTGIESPDAIITATGYGCMEDTVTFLAKITQESRQALNPTPFIQSTHNAVAGVIALHLKSNSYNNTFTQRGFSFESALTEALILLEDGSTNNILIGGMDEMVTPVELIINTIRLIRPHNGLTVPVGEGTVFFTLSRTPSESSARITGFETIYRPAADEPAETLKRLIEKHGSPDLIFAGLNGNPYNDKYYRWISSFLPDKIIINYKRYCGEYPTAPSFAHWLACRVVKEKIKTGLPCVPQNVVVYNHHENRNHSFTVIKR